MIFPYYQVDYADFDRKEEVDSDDMWLTVDENGEYVIHFWENGQLVEQKLDETKFPVIEEYMEVIGE